MSMNGPAWTRPKDTIGLGFAVDRASAQALRLLAAGGLGILVGDGRLQAPGAEKILEANYRAALDERLQVSLNYQFVNNPAYNRQRGPVSIVGIRGDVQF